MSNYGPNDMSGANPMSDTLAFVKQLWGSMKIPGMAMPSLSPEEIDKQIADLKAVESWLQVNMNMLRGSIQALEVQSATLTALCSVGESFAKAASGAGASTAADDKPEFESPFQPSSQSAFQSSFESPFQSPFQSPLEQATPSGSATDPASMAAPFANAAVWWNAMQEQFSNVVSQAMQQASPSQDKPGEKADSKKPAAKKSASSKPAVPRERAKKAKRNTKTSPTTVEKKTQTKVKKKPTSTRASTGASKRASQDKADSISSLASDSNSKAWPQ